MNYKIYCRSIGFSDDSMAYTSPYYTYDKRFSRAADYREFMFDLYKKYDVKIASLFFTDTFIENIPINSKTLKTIEKVFFNKGYLQWT